MPWPARLRKFFLNRVPLLSGMSWDRFWHFCHNRLPLVRDMIMRPARPRALGPGHPRVLGVPGLPDDVRPPPVQCPHVPALAENLYGTAYGHPCYAVLSRKITFRREPAAKVATVDPGREFIREADVHVFSLAEPRRTVVVIGHADLNIPPLTSDDA